MGYTGTMFNLTKGTTMKDNAEHYIDLAYLQGQLLALYETRNRLQEEINKKEAEVKQERDKK